MTAITNFFESEGDDPKKFTKGMREMLGPQALDMAVRNSITMCWMMLPDADKNVAAVERELRRVVERALQNLREDASVFGIPKE